MTAFAPREQKGDITVPGSPQRMPIRCGVTSRGLSWNLLRAAADEPEHQAATRSTLFSPGLQSSQTGAQRCDWNAVSGQRAVADRQFLAWRECDHHDAD